MRASKLWLPPPRFVEALRVEDSLGMLPLPTRSRWRTRLRRTERTRSSALAVPADGGTALYDALCDSLLMLKGLKGRRAVVVLTDGRDEHNPGTGPGSVRSWDTVLRLLQDQEVTVFPVGLGPRIDAQRLELLASLSGGSRTSRRRSRNSRGSLPGSPRTCVTATSSATLPPTRPGTASGGALSFVHGRPTPHQQP